MTETTQALGRSEFRRVSGVALPVFVSGGKRRAVFYAPRQVCVLADNEMAGTMRQIHDLAREDDPVEPPASDRAGAARLAARYLVQAARRADLELSDPFCGDFAPECLTLYVNNRCNLRCVYCYSRPAAARGMTVSTEAVNAAIRLVAEACAARRRSFTLAVHGGGEPTLNRQLVDAALDTAAEEANRLGIPLQTYIATNGAVSGKMACWLADRFDLIGVSCDGPPEIHDRHRPGHDGLALGDCVKRTILTRRRLGTTFDIRTTITDDTVDRQAEVVSYLAENYAPREIRLEPVYATRSGVSSLEAGRAAAFVAGFLAARSAGARRGVRVTTSITRPGDVYGPYCQVPRRVLNLIPGDVVTGCFLDSRRAEALRRGVLIGAFDRKRGVLQLDDDRIRHLSARCRARPPACRDCLCSRQCTYGCPDRCLLNGCEPVAGSDVNAGRFRCTVNRMLLERLIGEAAENAWENTPPGLNRQSLEAHGLLKVATFREKKRS